VTLDRCCRYSEASYFEVYCIYACIFHEKREKRPNGKKPSKSPSASPCAMCGVDFIYSRYIRLPSIHMCTALSIACAACSFLMCVHQRCLTDMLINNKAVVASLDKLGANLSLKLTHNSSAISVDGQQMQHHQTVQTQSVQTRVLAHACLSLHQRPMYVSAW
jgi:hypothetical protein